MPTKSRKPRRRSRYEGLGLMGELERQEYGMLGIPPEPGFWPDAPSGFKDPLEEQTIDQVDDKITNRNKARQARRLNKKTKPSVGGVARNTTPEQPSPNPNRPSFVPRAKTVLRVGGELLRFIVRPGGGRRF